MAILGPEFLVNSTTPDDQYSPEITTLSTGGFVATWKSFDNGDGSGACIRARLFDAAGSPLGPDFIVNVTSSSEFYPSITALATGGFVATWASWETWGYGIRARLFDATGAGFDTDFIVNSTTDYSLYNETAALSSGGFVTIWSSEDKGGASANCIRARLFDSAGSALGQDFIVNSTTVNSVIISPAVAALSTGGFVATWMSDETGDSAGEYIRARLFNSTGTAQGQDFVVNSTTLNSEYNASPAITALPTGGFVTTWASRDPGDGSGDCIRARLFNANGVAVGQDFIVNSTTNGYESSPAITALGSSGFVATWTSNEGSDGSGNCIRARAFDANGAALGQDFIVNITADDSQYSPAITALSSGRFVVTWTSEDKGDGSKSCIRAIVLDIEDTGVTIKGTAEADTISGSRFDDKLSGGDLNDLISAGAGSDSVTGGRGSDILNGCAGDDILKGGAGADTLNGGSGNDILIGGRDADRLTGGSGVDTFTFFSTSEGGDKITDFEGAGTTGGDKIDLQAIDSVPGGSDDVFVFGGTAATAHGVWYAISFGRATIFADTDGNAATAEFTVTIASPSPISAIARGDFVL